MEAAHCLGCNKEVYPAKDATENKYAECIKCGAPYHVDCFAYLKVCGRPACGGEYAQFTHKEITDLILTQQSLPANTIEGVLTKFNELKEKFLSIKEDILQEETMTLFSGSPLTKELLVSFLKEYTSVVHEKYAPKMKPILMGIIGLGIGVLGDLVYAFFINPSHLPVGHLLAVGMYFGRMHQNKREELDFEKQKPKKQEEIIKKYQKLLAEIPHAH